MCINVSQWTCRHKAGPTNPLRAVEDARLLGVLLLALRRGVVPKPGGQEWAEEGRAGAWCQRCLGNFSGLFFLVRMRE